MHSAPPPTWRQSPVTSGIARIGADRRAGAVVALQAEPDPDRRGPRGREPLAEPRARRRRRARTPPPRARPATRRAAPRAPASRPCGARASRGRLGAGVEHGAHQPERERGVRARQRRDVLVAAGRRVGADRIDGDDVRAARSGLEHERPLVEVRRSRFAPQSTPAAPRRCPPGRSRPRRRESRAARPGAAAVQIVRVAAARRRGGGTGAGPSVQPWTCAHRARVVVGQDRLGPVALDGVLQARPPTSRIASSHVICSKRPSPLRPDAAQRMQEPVRAVDGVEVVVDLAAQRAARERVVAVRRAASCPPVPSTVDLPRARVRAVERAESAHHRGCHAATVAELKGGIR